MKSAKTIVCLLALIACFSLAGCVERALVINSEPPGARCYIDSEFVGETPLVLPFTFYGEREIILRLDGYLSVREVVSLSPPWYEYIPLDPQ